MWPVDGTDAVAATPVTTVAKRLTDAPIAKPTARYVGQIAITGLMCLKNQENFL